MKDISLPTTVVAIGEKPKPVSRQVIRHLGLRQVLAEVSLVSPMLTRRERRAQAHAMHRQAWKNRDQQAVKKLTHPE